MVKNSAIEIGQKCKRFRNALGMSQATLADMINTTPQNISKYEKDGISNIEIIQELSEALRHDLLIDEIDEEGTVGEIGKEILGILISYRGYMDFSEIKKGIYAYHLPEERLINEIFKLEKIGLVVREQYTDPMRNEKDELYITAKGAITLKHVDRAGYEDSRHSILNKEGYITTYESATKGFHSIQEYIDSKEYDDDVINIEIKNAFRLNFINYITDKLGYGDSFHTDYFEGRGIYHDILHSMVCELSRDKADLIIREYRMRAKLSGENWNEDPVRKDILGNDRVIEDYLYDVCFEKAPDDLYTDDIRDWFEDRIKYYPKDRKELIDYYYEIRKLDMDSYEILVENHSEKYYKKKFKEMRGKLDQNIPSNWFSVDEIKSFIRENILPAESDDENKINDLLARIVENHPEVLEYFTFPYAWEINGIADMIREIYKIPRLEKDIKNKEYANNIREIKKKSKVVHQEIYAEKYADENGNMRKRIIVEETGEILVDSDEQEFVDATPLKELIMMDDMTKKMGKQFIIKPSGELPQSFIDKCEKISEDE